ncbi:MAG TPA: invasion associated locus B family protein [Xanthobacteraceae bacterium]|nr:invasion associated locus B family protein [Xanthobacteraceae bacterium]
MRDRKLSLPISNARKIAVPTIAATLLSATGFGIDMAVAQQRPAAPAAPVPPVVQKPAAQAVKVPAAPGATTQAVAPGSGPETPPLIYSPWAKFCGKGNEPDAKQVCFTGKEGRLDSGLPVVGAALIEPEGGPNKVLRVTLPNGVSVKHGSHISIDNNKDPYAAPFVVCFTNGCMADFEATAELVAKLKSGHTLMVEAVNMAGNAFGFQVPLIDASGNSFVKANEGPPTDPKVFEEQQRKLQQHLQMRD